MKSLKGRAGLALLVVSLCSPSARAIENAHAAQVAAESDPACKPLQPFYWEIGTKDSVLASGSTGDRSVTRSSSFGIASASKWVFAAYVIEKSKGGIDALTNRFLHLSAGYVSMPTFSCIFQPTVQGCFSHGENSKLTPEAVGHFFYNGGHFQKWAVDHDLGRMDRASLADEYRKVLGPEIPFEFKIVQLAGGLRMSAASYALFLQKILRGQLRIRDHLGERPVCTLPLSCPGQAMRSPIPVAWHYSYGHWIEDAPGGGDGSFSSPGAFGFYPWIDASKTHYGILSRHEISRRGERKVRFSLPRHLFSPYGLPKISKNCDSHLVASVRRYLHKRVER